MSMTSLVVSGVFFVLAMIVVFMLRASDQRTKSYKNTVRKLEQHETEVRNYDEEFKKDVAEIAATLKEQTTTARELLQSVASELVELKSYSEDLGKLHSSMTAYQNSITALVRLTEDTEAKIAELRTEFSDYQKRIPELEKEASYNITALAEKTDSEFREVVATFETKYQGLSNSISEALSKVETATADLTRLAEANIQPEPEPEPVTISGVKVNEKHSNISFQDMDFDNEESKKDSGEIIFS